jgi:hypothetical protein
MDDADDELEKHARRVFIGFMVFGLIFTSPLWLPFYIIGWVITKILNSGEK